MCLKKSNVYESVVTDKNGNKRNFTVKISSDGKSNYRYKPSCRKLVFFYVVFFTLSILMTSSLFVKWSSDKDEYKNDSSYELSANTVKIKNNNSVLKKYDNSILFICMTFFCSTGIVLLGIVLIKDDSEISFSKLNSLLLLKEEFDSQKDYEQTEENCNICPLKKNADDLSISCCCKTISKKKNLYGELSKTLMNSISEI